MRRRASLFAALAVVALLATTAHGGLVPSENARRQTVEADTTLNIAGTLEIAGVDVTATAAELNLLDGAIDGAGTKNGAAVAVSETGNQAVHRTIFTLTALSITITDATTAGAHGSHKLYDFPAGAIQALGCSYDLTTLAGAGGISDTAAVVGALGSVTTATDNATLTTTEADFIASTAGTLTAGAGVLQNHGSLVATAFDGTTTAVDLFLNVAVPDADSSANDTLAVSGTITCLWANLGDY
jgi:hypothetical protein